MSDRLRRALPLVIGLVLFCVALGVLRIEFRSIGWDRLRLDMAMFPRWRLTLAVALTALNYVLLTGYDLLGFAYIGRRLPAIRIAFTSLIAFAVSNAVGLPTISGASIRYRFYSRWGLTPDELSRLIFASSVTFWLGLLTLGGLSLATTPLAGVTMRGLHEAAPAGWLLMAAPLAYVASTTVRRRPLALWRFHLQVPRPALAGAQLLVSCLEWAVAAAVLYVLLPPSALGFLPFLARFLAATLLGIISHMPGGIGVFETLMLLMLQPYIASSQALPALVVYRFGYFVLPLAVAVIALAADELYRRRAHLKRAGAAFAQTAAQVTPRLLAVATFFAGFVLLISGSMPSAHSRLALLGRVVPIGVIELSHFAGSVAGAVLLLLSHGLWRRLDGAYYLTCALVVAGITTSLLRGFAYEDAMLLAAVLVALWGARRAFSRRAAFFDARFSLEWVVAIGAAVGASVWLGFFAYQHVQYSNQLWWQFELYGDAPRFLRASVGAAVVVVLFGMSMVASQAQCRLPAPSEADLADAENSIACQSATTPNLVFLRDKAVLFEPQRRAFVMYGVQGRTWVALGEPVGPDEFVAPAAYAFLERCDDFGGVPVFYEIPKDHLHHFIDLGLTVIKLGEYASVRLPSFTLEGARGARHRQVVRRLARDGCSFRVVQGSELQPLLHDLRDVSDEWLSAKAAGEKGFSLGFFDEAYLSRFAVAVLERRGRVEAFANIWRGAPRTEASADLMRHRRDAPKDAMHGLFVHMMEWAKAEGYERFGLGMAPLSGFQQSPVAPFWNRLARLMYRHGASVYNFQGLRAYKEKFDPEWEPRYLAYAGGLRLPLVLADVAALIAGGYRRIFVK